MIKTLCLKPELDRYTQYCREEYTRKGTIVELGPWLGSSTEAILKGLRGDDVVHIFDTFIWTRQLQWYAEDYKPVEIGDSFLHVTLANLSYDNRIKPYVVDLSKIFPWNEEIEFLILDAAKSHDAFVGIVRSFFTHLIEGAYLFDQDFSFCPPLHIYQKVVYYYLKDNLKPIDKHGYGVGFRVEKRIQQWQIGDCLKRMWFETTKEIILETVNYFKDYL